MKRPRGAAVSRISRRQFAIAGISGLAGAAWAGSEDPRPTPPAEKRRKLRVAAVNSIFRLRSHAYHIVGRMVFGFQKDGVAHQPNLQVVRMYDDQQPADDLGPSFCKNHDIQLVKTVGEALGGSGGLVV